jgi:hypothetical protein
VRLEGLGQLQNQIPHPESNPLPSGLWHRSSTNYAMLWRAKHTHLCTGYDYRNSCQHVSMLRVSCPTKKRLKQFRCYNSVLLYYTTIVVIHISLSLSLPTNPVKPQIVCNRQSSLYPNKRLRGTVYLYCYNIALETTINYTRGHTPRK